jgi:hypothetical protein
MLSTVQGLLTKVLHPEDFLSDRRPEVAAGHAQSVVAPLHSGHAWLTFC